MERLVEWNCKEKNSALPIAINNFGDVVSTEDICAQLATIYDIIGDYDIDRLRELIRADRDGLTVRLLFKVGDKVYETFCGRIVEKQIISIAFLISKSECRVSYHAENARHAVTTIDSKDVGETVFPTREEAEAALEKMQEAAHE